MIIVAPTITPTIPGEYVARFMDLLSSGDVCDCAFNVLAFSWEKNETARPEKAMEAPERMASSLSNVSVIKPIVENEKLKSVALCNVIMESILIIIMADSPTNDIVMRKSPMPAPYQIARCQLLVVEGRVMWLPCLYDEVIDNLDAILDDG